MTRLGLEKEIVDRKIYERTLAHFREARIRLPRFAELAEPSLIPPEIVAELRAVDPDEPHPLNLFRVHWHNAPDRRARVDVPDHLVLTKPFTGVDAPILVALGERFPLIRAHKVLAAYGCLVPRIVTGQFDPSRHRAVWPSTGNYCRGGVAISRIMGCHGVAVLPEGMSRERFEWLENWVLEEGDIIRTPGSESNVKEIYDECRELARNPDHVILNQFCEFGNHLAHYACTGPALERVLESHREAIEGLEAAVFVSATGSAGTLAAGDYLKERFGTRITAVEALECPTLLYNGYGTHNIQGIGDKHVPLIHNALNTDFVVGVSDKATDCLNLLFNSDVGREYLKKTHQIPERLLSSLGLLGLSSLANVIASIKVARLLGLKDTQAILTVATDSAAMYATERAKTLAARFSGEFNVLHAAEVFGEHWRGASTDHVLELTQRDRERIFNLGYFTWVEQQDVSIEEFDARRSPDFWRDLRQMVPTWDAFIAEFNARTGLVAAAR